MESAVVVRSMGVPREHHGPAGLRHGIDEIEKPAPDFGIGGEICGGAVIAKNPHQIENEKAGKGQTLRALSSGEIPEDRVVEYVSVADAAAASRGGRTS